MVGLAFLDCPEYVIIGAGVLMALLGLFLTERIRRGRPRDGESAE